MKRKNVKVGMKVVCNDSGEILTVYEVEPDTYVGCWTVRVGVGEVNSEWVSHKDIKPYKEQCVVNDEEINFPHPLMQYIGCEVVIDDNPDRVGWIVRIDCNCSGVQPFLVSSENGLHRGGAYVEPYYKDNCNWMEHERLQLVNEDGTLSSIPA